MGHKRTSGFTSRQSGQNPVALLISWDVDTDLPMISVLSKLLSTEFGYAVTFVSLPPSNPERLLADEISSALPTQTSNGANPFLIYYLGGGSHSDGRLYWKPKATSDGPPTVDWLRIRQQKLDPSVTDVLVIIDCNHGRISTSPQESPFLEQRLGQGTGKLEILTAPQLATPYRPSFTRVLIENMGDLSRTKPDGSFTIKSLKAAMQKAFDTKKPVLHYNLTPASDQSLIRLEAHPSEGQDDNSIAVDSVRPTHSKNLPDIPDYQNVVVLPITWDKIVGWNAEEELGLLLDTFGRHFDYELKDIVKIPVCPQPELFLQAQIRNRITKLGSRDLFIVLYNGHATDASKSGRMLLLGDAMSNVSVDWTEHVHELNHARCDVVQILDCCYAAGGTKGEGDKEEEISKINRAANSDTKSEQYFGKNETLAACARESKAPVGEGSSTRLFAKVLDKLAAAETDFSIDDWYHHIDTEVSRAFSAQERRKWCTPYRKMNPITYAQSSIRLRTKLFLRYSGR